MRKVLVLANVIFVVLLGNTFASVIDDLRFEQRAIIKNKFSSHPESVGDCAPDGAVSLNITWEQTGEGNWYIELQRSAADAIVTGIVTNTPSTIERGLLILQWGFDHENQDGSFSCPDKFHSTSFFVEAAARSCLMLQAAGIYLPNVEYSKDFILRSALWMTLPNVEASGQRNNAPYTHRRYLVAAALGEAGVLCGNGLLIQKSQEYILDGLSLQTPEGINPEKGGYDSSYQAVGLGYASRYYKIVPKTQAVRDGMYTMLAKANDWLSMRITSNGTPIATGNTRTGLGQETGRDGTPKPISASAIMRALEYWFVIGGDDRYHQLAIQVSHH
jgi:hypothetical protein